MSVSEQRMPLEQARKLAESIMEYLRPACERIEIAGSVRRGKPTVGDIELVAIPIITGGGLFGDEPVSALNVLLLAGLPDADRLKNGPKYKQYLVHDGYEGIKLDLNITAPEEWGVVMAIKTGPAQFSKSLVTPRRKGGRLPSDCKISGNRVWRGGTLLPTPDERDFLELAGGWINPQDRE